MSALLLLYKIFCRGYSTMVSMVELSLKGLIKMDYDTEWKKGECIGSWKEREKCIFIDYDYKV